VDFLAYLAFSGALIIFMASPGPGTFGVIARALGSGFTHAFSMTLGMALGDLIFLLLAIFGLNFIATMMGDVFTIVKYIGGLYLIYLGIQIFKSKPAKAGIKSSKSVSFIGDFISGLLICLSNPKTILFYLGFLPNFVNLATLQTLDIIVLSTIVVFTLTLVLGGYSYFAARARTAMKRPRTQTIMNRFAGSVMVAAGGALIAKS
jgi:threonine/homoserine/homoserine lactone efflux protein